MAFDFGSAALAILAFVGGQIVIAFISEWRAGREAGRRRAEAAEARLFERRAEVYVEVVEALSRIQERMAMTLPAKGRRTHQDPTDLTEEQREALSVEGRRLDALLVAFGSDRLRDLLSKVPEEESNFWATVREYIEEGGEESLEKDHRYTVADVHRHFHSVAVQAVRDQIGEELGAVRPGMAPKEQGS